MHRKEKKRETSVKLKKKQNLQFNRNKKKYYEDIIQGQDTKGVGRMPWHREPKKDVANDEMPGGDVSSH